MFVCAGPFTMPHACCPRARDDVATASPQARRRHRDLAQRVCEQRICICNIEVGELGRDLQPNLQRAALAALSQLPSERERAAAGRRATRSRLSSCARWGRSRCAWHALRDVSPGKQSGVLIGPGRAALAARARKHGLGRSVGCAAVPVYHPAADERRPLHRAGGAAHDRRSTGAVGLESRSAAHVAADRATGVP